MRVSAVLLLAWSLWAQSPGGAGAVFPSDSEAWKSDWAGLLEAVCPGKVVAGPPGCHEWCPLDSGFGSAAHHYDASLDAVTRGHFLSPTSEDAVLWMTGCEAHSSNYGGTILLTKKSGRWSMLWYKVGVQTDQCHRTPLRGGREILVCMAEYLRQGNVSVVLSTEDLLNHQPVLGGDDGTFFMAFDNMATCGWNQQDQEKPFSLVRSGIDRVEFLAKRVNGVPVVSITASFGTKRMSHEDIEVCVREPNSFLPPTRSYRMEFVFNGHGYEPAPSSAAVVEMFEGQ